MKDIFTLASLTLLPALAFAQPANDDCAGAIALPTTTQTSPTFSAVSTVGATRSLPSPLCTGSSANDDVWFSFVATGSEMELSYRNLVASGGSSSGLGYAIHSACPAESSRDRGQSELSCDFTFGSGGAGTQNLNAFFTPGETYLLRLYAQGGSSFATAEVALYPVSEGDACSASVPTVPVAAAGSTPTFTPVSTVGSTQGPRSNTSVTWLNDDVWVQFVANNTGVQIDYRNLVTTSGDAATGIGYGLYASCSGGELASAGSFGEDGAGSEAVESQTPLVPGRTYYLRVFLRGAGNFGTFDLGLTGVAAPNAGPLNDDFRDRTITISQGSVFGAVWQKASTQAATSALEQPCAQTSGDDDIWYRFTAGSDNLRLSYRNLVAAAGSSVGYTVYDLADGGVPIGCSTLTDAVGTSGSGNVDLTTALVDGQEYFLSLFVRGIGGGEFEFAILEQSTSDNAIVAPVPAEDACLTVTETLDGSGGFVLFETAKGEPIVRVSNDEALGATTVSYTGTTGAVRTAGPDGPPYLSRNIAIVPATAPVNDVTVGLYFTTDEYADLANANGGNFSFDEYVLARREGTTCTTDWDGSGEELTPRSGSFFAGEFGRRTDFVVPALGEFFLVPNSTVLPVAFASVAAAADGARNRVTFAVALEEDVAAYVLERATAAAPDVFAPVTEAAPRGLDGAALATYRVYDDAPAAVSYYRVRAVDFDGAETVSAVVSVTRAAGGGGVRVYPNPANAAAADALAVELPADGGARDVRVVDATGRVVYAARLQPGRQTIALGPLASGVYHLAAAAGDDVRVVRLVIQ